MKCTACDWMGNGTCIDPNGCNVEILFVKGLDHEKGIEKRKKAFADALMDLLDAKTRAWMSIQSQIEKGKDV